MSDALAELRAKLEARRLLPAPAERRRLREAVGAGLRDIAVPCGVSLVAVSQWERGICEPSDRHLAAYLEVLALFREVASDR